MLCWWWQILLCFLSYMVTYRNGTWCIIVSQLERSLSLLHFRLGISFNVEIKRSEHRLDFTFWFEFLLHEVCSFNCCRSIWFIRTFSIPSNITLKLHVFRYRWFFLFFTNIFIWVVLNVPPHLFFSAKLINDLFLFSL